MQLQSVSFGVIPELRHAAYVFSNRADKEQETTTVLSADTGLRISVPLRPELTGPLIACADVFFGDSQR